MGHVGVYRGGGELPETNAIKLKLELAPTPIGRHRAFVGIPKLGGKSI